MMSHSHTQKLKCDNHKWQSSLAHNQQNDDPGQKFSFGMRQRREILTVGWQKSNWPTTGTQIVVFLAKRTREN